MNWILLAQAVAEETGTAGDPASTTTPPAFWHLLLPFAVIFGIFYFLLIRPQKKQEKARRAMLADLKKNDKVVTIGGIRGVVATVREKDVILKVDEAGNVRMRFSRGAISRIVSKDEEDGETEDLS